MGISVGIFLCFSFTISSHRNHKSKSKPNSLRRRKLKKKLLYNTLLIFPYQSSPSFYPDIHVLDLNLIISLDVIKVIFVFKSSFNEVFPFAFGPAMNFPFCITPLFFLMVVLNQALLIWLFFFLPLTSN